jgi:dTDP-4-dehydrorhamnose reductase
VKAVILGAGGQVGRALSAALPDAVALSRAQLDVADPMAVAAVDWSGVDTVFNAAAYTAVDGAETPDGRVAAWQANAVGVANVARVAREQDITLVHVSSEYVFDGRATGAIPETAPLSPLSTYGASKAAGDVAAALAPKHYVVRTTWVVGDGANFIRTMLGLAARGVAPAVVADQIGRPTFADDLARGLVRLVASGAHPGVYNLTNTGDPVSWADVARVVFALAGREPCRVTNTTTADYFADKPHAAVRPLNSVLDLAKAYAAGVELPAWRASLITYVQKECANP